MYSKTDKRRIYWLIEQFLSDKITEKVFCDEFYYCYSLELEYETLTSKEELAFSELDAVISRFSEFEEDHRLYPNMYFTKTELRNKVVETKEKLKGEFESYKLENR
jgi:Bacterial self-protective colicin-like immunity